MSHPLGDGTPPTTPYGARRPGLWTACGYHTGADWARPIGTPVHAVVDGDWRIRNYGAAFGIQGAVSPDTPGEWFYAHLSSCLPEGTRVQAGDIVGRVGQTGNVTGPHLHLEYHPTVKQRWGCDVAADPWPAIQALTRIGPGPVYLSKLKYGQTDSDSVKRLQQVLNSHTLAGGQTLPESGNYLTDTDHEVRLCQHQHGFGDDPAGASFVGPKQADHLFHGGVHTVVDDLPKDPDPPPAPQLVPGAVWDPIPGFTGLRPFAAGGGKKILLHTTEGDTKPDWQALGKGIPHLTVDLGDNSRWQHLPLDVAAYSLVAPDGGPSPNSDAGWLVQVELVGWSRNVPSWNQLWYDRLRDLLGGIGGITGAPIVFPFPFTGPDGAGLAGRVRQTWDTFRAAPGVVGHSHVPWNQHWDPGALDPRLLTTPPPTPDPDPDPDPGYASQADLDRIAAQLDALARRFDDHHHGPPQ